MTKPLRLISTLFLFVACGDDEAATNDVARCEQAAQDLSTACADDIDDGRPCMSEKYGDYCADAVRPDLFADAIDCLNQHSTIDGCRTFADPSGAADCVDAVYAGFDAPEAEAFISAFSAMGGYADQPERFMPPAYVLTSGQLAQAQSCLNISSDIDAAYACLGSTVQAPLDSCFQ